MILWKTIKEKMQENLTQTVCEDSAEMTYEELIVFAEEFAKNLKDVQCCAILCRSEISAALAVLSCFAAEVTALPLSYRYGELHCNKIIDEIGPDAIITDYNGRLEIMHIIDYTYKEPEIHPALIMCTSGTTQSLK